MSASVTVLRLAWIDIHRMLRVHTDVRSSSSAILGGIFFVAWILVGMLGGAYVGRWMGRNLLGENGLDGFGVFAIADARGVVAVFWFIFTLIYVIRTIGQRGVLSQPTAILPVVPTHLAFLGVILAEYVYFTLWMVIPALGFGVGLSLGTNSVLPIAVVPAAILVAGASVVSVGYLVGLTIRHVATRNSLIVRYKVPIILGVALLYFMVLATGFWDRLMESLFEPLQRSPMGWYGDLVFFGTSGIDATPGRAFGALALTIVATGIAVVAGSRVADRHWFSDPAPTDRSAADSTADREHSPVGAWLVRVLGAPQAALVTGSWRLAYRSPFKLLYAFYPFLILAGVFAQIVQTGEVPRYLPYVVLVSLVWAAGVIFTLNPLGDQGPALPSTLLSRIDGSTFVRAHLFASLVVTAPVGTLITALTTWLSPVGAQEGLWLAVITPIAMIVAAAFSIGLGMAFPRFEATKVTRSEKTILPSRWAFLVFTGYVIVVAVAAASIYDAGFRELVAVILGLVIPFGVSVTPAFLQTAATVVLVPLLLVPIVSYRYAIRRFDRYTIA